MAVPEVTVIMPVYNAEKFVRDAINSILKQFLQNFQFVIIDDKSTDASAEIIRSYDDNRITFIQQQQNCGVVTAMNLGLEAASAPFVAIMHADDISSPDRLKLQYLHLQKNNGCAVLAGRTVYIDETGRETGEKWKLDEETITAASIRATMIKENCITHSSVMFRKDVITRYKYQGSPKHIGYAVEDYPLWLNILSDGFEIHKLSEKILQYRTHNKSATSSFLRKNNPFMVNYLTKQFYLEQRQEAGQLTSFDRKVRSSMRWDYTMGILKNIKKTMIG